MSPFEKGIPVDRPTHRPAPSHIVPARIITEWPIGTFVENLVVLDDETVLVSIVSSASIERVSLRDGARSVFARFPKEPTGITRMGDRFFINVGTPGQPGWSIWEADLEGSVSELAHVPRGLFLNGNTALSTTRLLAVDSILGEVFAIDTTTGQVTSWLQHALLTKSSPEPMMPGANGIQVVGDDAYFTSTERALVLMCPIHEGRAGEMSILAEQFVGDDFAVDAAGNLFITTHVHNQLQRLSPEGIRTVIAGPDQHMHGSTSCAFDSKGDLLVTTTGGILAPIDGQVRAAKLVELETGRLA
ncbi:MAG: hypothetical protein AAGD38_14710 [Acidobacteriota bacterium]